MVGVISFRDSFHESPDGSQEADDALSSQLYSKLREQLNPLDFDTWFAATPCEYRLPDCFVLKARNKFHRAWLAKEYADIVLAAARSFCDFDPQLVIEIDPSAAPPRSAAPSIAPASRRPSRRLAPRITPRTGKTRDHTPSGDPSSPRTNPDFTFENFVAGRGCEVPHAAALAVAEQPCQSYNPLYLYGEPGVGKTHLLQAIFHHLEEHHFEGQHREGDHRKDTRLQQIYVNADGFASQYGQANETRTLDAFRRRYRATDVLLLDELHFVPSRSRTQEELFHTLQTLLGEGRQVVITSQCPPSEISGLHERLATSFQGGLVAQLKRPDVDTRLGILVKKASLRGCDLPRETAEFLATHVAGNPRELEGALNHLIGLSALHHGPLSLKLARIALQETEDESHSRSSAINVELILRTIEDYYGFKQKDLLSSSKVRSLVYARQIGMFLARELTSLSLEQIGLRFGGRDHSTVLYAQTCIKRQLKKNPQTRIDLQILRSRLHTLPTS